MVLSEAVYSTSLEEVSPLVKGAGKFTFDQLIQATLLDVIDRGNVSIISEGDAVGLRLVKEDGLSSFEKDCLNLAFSGKKKKLFPICLRTTRYLIAFIVEQKSLMKTDSSKRASTQIFF